MSSRDVVVQADDVSVWQLLPAAKSRRSRSSAVSARARPAAARHNAAIAHAAGVLWVGAGAAPCMVNLPRIKAFYDKPALGATP